MKHHTLARVMVVLAILALLAGASFIVARNGAGSSDAPAGMFH